MTYYVLSFDVGIKNLAYCLIEFNLETNKERILLWEVLPIFESKRKSNKKTTSAKNIPYQVLSEHLYLRLEEIKDKILKIPSFDSDLPMPMHIIIERQMAPKMKTLAGMIFMYFSVYQNLNTFNNFSIKTLIYYNAKHKLSDMVYNPKEKDEIQLKEIKSPKNSYNYRKNLSKQYCNILIHRNQSDNFIEFFKASKKKDDLSDCFLQAISFIKLDKFDKLNKIK